MMRQRWWKHPLLLQHSWEIFFGITVGVLAGLGVILFKLALHHTTQWLQHDLATAWTGAGIPRVLYLPFLLGAAGGVVAWMRRHLLPPERYHGVSSIIRAIFYGGSIPYWATPWKALASVISISAGASVGPEDPSVQIGASMGAWLSRRLRLSMHRTRMLIATGAAAGIATAFNAPIAGVFFAIEIILREFATGTLGVLILGAVAASVLSRAVFGPQPAFPIPPYTFHSVLEFPLYFGLGVLATLVSFVYIRALDMGHRLFHPLPRALRPVVMGVVLGGVAAFMPALLGDSYEMVSDILHGAPLSLGFLGLFLALKILATAGSLGSGFVGGVFAPSLALGAALGGAYGMLMARLLPGLTLEPSAYALVGMAAVLAGTVRAPVTAIMLLFEMTDDYHILLPMMVSVIVCVFLSEILEPESVYTLSLVRDGFRIRTQERVDILETLRVRDVMKPPPDVLKVTMTLEEAAQRMERVRAHGLPVVDEQGNLVGVLSVSDIEYAVTRDPNNIYRPIRDFCTYDLIVAYPDETVAQALRKMVRRDIGRLPVVDPENPRRMIGWLNRADIIRAYEMALMQQVTEQYKAEQVQLETMGGTPVIEVQLDARSPWVGKRVQDIPWPKEVLLASIHRGREVLIPHGDTRLQPGDRLILITSPEAWETVQAFLESQAA